MSVLIGLGFMRGWRWATAAAPEQGCFKDESNNQLQPLAEKRSWWVLGRFTGCFFSFEIHVNFLLLSTPGRLLPHRLPGGLLTGFRGHSARCRGQRVSGEDFDGFA